MSNQIKMEAECYDDKLTPEGIYYVHLSLKTQTLQNLIDPSNRKMVWDYLARLNREQGVTCILVTHNVLEAEKVIQRVAVMQKGRIIALGTPGELKSQAGSNIRLEFQIKEGETFSFQDLQNLGELGKLEEFRSGQYRLYLPREQVGAATNLVVNQLGLVRLDDFRLAPPSLEDVYLELDGLRVERKVLV